MVPVLLKMQSTDDQGVHSAGAADLISTTRNE